MSTNESRVVVYTFDSSFTRGMNRRMDVQAKRGKHYLKNK
jgi:hypothetical protein